MRMILAAAAAAAVCFSAAGASAQTAPPTSDLLQKLCIETDAQTAPALAAADADGWATLAKEAVPIPPSMGFTLDDYAVRLKASGKDALVLLVGHGEMSSIGYKAPADVCMVVFKPQDPAAIDRAKAWAGVSPLVTQAAQGIAVYAFIDEAGGHKMLIGDQSGEALIKAGKAKMVLVVTPPGKDLAVLGYIHLRAASAVPAPASTSDPAATKP